MQFGYAANQKSNDIKEDHTNVGSFKLFIYTDDFTTKVTFSSLISGLNLPVGPVPTDPTNPLVGFTNFKETLMR